MRINKQIKTVLSRHKMWLARKWAGRPRVPRRSPPESVVSGRFHRRRAGGVCGWSACAGFTVLDYAVVNVEMFYVLAIVGPSFTAHALQCNVISPVRQRDQ